MLQRPVYQEIAAALLSKTMSQDKENRDWALRWSDRIDWLVSNALPSGSGVDSGTTLNEVKSTPDKLVFDVGYHHMDQSGMYDGWTHHEVIVTPSLVWGLSIRITGRNRNDIKDYLGELYHHALTVTAPDYPEGL